MNEDKINQTIEIILQNQAQFYADLQMLQEANKEAEKRAVILERAVVNLYNAQTKTNETVEKLADKIDGLADAQKETDERLNAVIFTAEKFFGKNGGKTGT